MKVASIHVRLLYPHGTLALLDESISSRAKFDFTCATCLSPKYRSQFQPISLRIGCQALRVDAKLMLTVKLGQPIVRH